MNQATEDQVAGFRTYEISFFLLSLPPFVFALIFLFKGTRGILSVVSSGSEASCPPHLQALLFLDALLWERQKSTLLGAKTKGEVTVCQCKAVVYAMPSPNMLP